MGRIQSAEAERIQVKAVEGSKKYVQNYPFATVAAAIAIGMLISLFAKAVRNRRK